MGADDESGVSVRKVLVELTVRSSGNHRYARESVVTGFVGEGVAGAHVRHGGYSARVVAARIVEEVRTDA